jgi:hypothetical protein
MWATWIVAAISLAAAVFMLRFLIALLREGAPSVCYRVVLVRREPEQVEVLCETYFDDDWRATEDDRGGCSVEFLENGIYAKQERSSNLIVPGSGAVSNRVGWRSIQLRGGHDFGEGL